MTPLPTLARQAVEAIFDTQRSGIQIQHIILAALQKATEASEKRVKELEARCENLYSIVKIDCESLEEAKAGLRGILTDHEIDGDSYMVPCAFVLISTLKEKVQQLRAELDQRNAAVKIAEAKK